MGSYEDWTAKVRGCLVWLGLPDPLLTRELAKSADETLQTLQLIIAAIHEADQHRKGLTCQRMIDLASQGKYPLMNELLSSLESPNSKSLGKTLSKYKDRVLWWVCGGFRERTRWGKSVFCA